MRFHYINRHEIAGFCGQFELRHLPSGDPVIDLSVATTNSWKDQQGQWHNDTEWHTCIFYRKLAEAANELLQKGSAVYVVGRTHTREWTAKDGSTRKRKEIIVEHFHPVVYTASQKGHTDGVDGEEPEREPDVSTAGFDQ